MLIREVHKLAYDIKSLYEGKRNEEACLNHASRKGKGNSELNTCDDTKYKCHAEDFVYLGVRGCFGGFSLHDVAVFVRLYEIEERKDEDPNEVNKMPIESYFFYHIVVTYALISTYYDLIENNKVQHNTREHMESMKPCDKEEEGCEI